MFFWLLIAVLIKKNLAPGAAYITWDPSKRLVLEKICPWSIHPRKIRFQECKTELNITRLLEKPNVRYTFHNSPPLFPITSKPVELNTHSHILFPLTIRSFALKLIL